MTLYLCYVAGGKCDDTFADVEVGEKPPKTHREFWVTDTLNAMGIDTYCAKQMRFVRKGKQRRPEPEISPYIGNYIFAEIPAQRYLVALGVKYLSSTTHALRRDDIAMLGAFRAAVDAEYAANDRKRLNREAVSEYEPGQALRFLDGRFSDSVVRFREIVERAHDLHPKIRATMEMMGRDVTMEIDPLAVKAAE